MASFNWNNLFASPIFPQSKEAAETWLSRGELWLVIFAALIVIGLIGELAADHRDKIWVPKRSGWDWPKIFAFVVIGAVVGELFCDADIWIASDALQIVSDREIANLRSPRGISAGQSRELTATLRSLGTKRFWVLTERSDADERSEQMLLSKQLLGAFLNAGWIRESHIMQPGQSDSPEFAPVSDRGISVQFATDPRSQELGNKVWKALENAELDCEMNPDPTQLPDTIIIEIGLR